MSEFNFPDLVLRFAYNSITAFIIIRYIYFHKEKRREFLFTFFVFNLLIFFVSGFGRLLLQG